MQKAFEKIVERLEEYKYSHLVEHDKERLEHCTENESTEHCEGIDCFWCVWEKAIKIVNKVAEEYKQEVCEWKQCGGNLRPYQTTSCEKFALHDISYVYCPYCGKRIKVIE